MTERPTLRRAKRKGVDPGALFLPESHVGNSGGASEG